MLFWPRSKMRETLRWRVDWLMMRPADRSCRATAPVGSWDHLGSKLTSWQEVAPTEDDSSGEAKMSTWVSVCVWIPWRNMIWRWRLWRDELASKVIRIVFRMHTRKVARFTPWTPWTKRGRIRSLLQLYLNLIGIPSALSVFRASQTLSSYGEDMDPQS